MKWPLLLFILASFSGFAQSNDAVSNSIVATGKRLYRSEMASWNGTDIFLEQFPDWRERSNGYFSYECAEGVRCVFLTREETPRVLWSATFPSDGFEKQSAVIDTVTRMLTAEEQSLYTIRQLALQEIRRDTGLFKQYQETNLNIIPTIHEGEKSVYVLTGPTKDGVVIFGNDYLLNFDGQDKLIQKKRLHANALFMQYSSGGRAFHSHVEETGPLITPTDICTLMLYETFAGWKAHYVISKSYVSIWSCEKNELYVMTREAWDNIDKQQSKEKEKKP